MLNETVKFTKEDGSEIIANVDAMNGGKWSLRFKDDSVKEFNVSDFKKFEIVDEDDHHEFVNEFLFARKDKMISKAADDFVSTAVAIVDFCPETYETIYEQFIEELQARVKFLNRNK